MRTHKIEHDRSFAFVHTVTKMEAQKQLMQKKSIDEAKQSKGEDKAKEELRESKEMCEHDRHYMNCANCDRDEAIEASGSTNKY